MHEFSFWGTEGIDFTLKSIRGVRFEVNGMVVISSQWWEAFRLFFGDVTTFPFSLPQLDTGPTPVPRLTTETLIYDR